MKKKERKQKRRGALFSSCSLSLCFARERERKVRDKERSSRVARRAIRSLRGAPNGARTRMFLEENAWQSIDQRGEGGRRGAAAEGKRHRSIGREKIGKNAARAFTLRAFHCPAPGASAQDSKGYLRLPRGIGELERRRGGGGGGGSRWIGVALARSLARSFLLPSFPPYSDRNRNLDLDLDLDSFFFLSFHSLTPSFSHLFSSDLAHQSQLGTQRRWRSGRRRRRRRRSGGAGQQQQRRQRSCSRRCCFAPPPLPSPLRSPLLLLPRRRSLLRRAAFCSRGRTPTPLRSLARKPRLLQLLLLLLLPLLRLLPLLLAPSTQRPPPPTPTTTTTTTSSPPRPPSAPSRTRS